jgi:hypothetical protein
MEPIQARLPDGTVLEFEEGTPDEVIDRVVKQHVSGGASAPQQAAPQEAGAFAPSEGGAPSEGAYYDVPSTANKAGFESALAEYYRTSHAVRRRHPQQRP